MKKIIFFFCFIIIATLFFRCKKEGNGQANIPPTDNSVFSRSDYDFSMFFEVEKTVLIRPVTQADTIHLSSLDKIVGLPRQERMKYSVCYSKDGYKELVIEWLTPKDAIVLPKEAMNTYLKEDYQKVRIINNTATYYDKNNKIIRTGDCKQDEKSLESIVNIISSNQNMTDAQFEQGLKIMKDNGIALTEHPNNIISMKQVEPNGESEVIVVDKKTRVIVGQLCYDAQQKLKSHQLIDARGDSKNLDIKKIFFVSFFKSFKGNIPMKAEQFSIFNNFKIVKK